MVPTTDIMTIINVIKTGKKLIFGLTIWGINNSIYRFKNPIVKITTQSF